jgi:hypothetical protein
MSNRCCSYIKLGFSAVLLAAAMTLQNATPVHAAIKAWSSAFYDQQMADLALPLDDLPVLVIDELETLGQKADAGNHGVHDARER